MTAEFPPPTDRIEAEFQERHGITPTPQPGADDAPFSDAPFGTAHRILTADTQYVGPHRRYNACLGCFEENATRLQEQAALVASLRTGALAVDASLTRERELSAALTRQRDELLAALEMVVTRILASEEMAIVDANQIRTAIANARGTAVR